MNMNPLPPPPPIIIELATGLKEEAKMAIFNIAHLSKRSNKIFSSKQAIIKSSDKI